MNDVVRIEWRGLPILVCYIVGLLLSILLEPMDHDFPYLTVGYLVYGVLLLIRFMVARCHHEHSRRYIVYSVLSIAFPFLCVALMVVLDAFVQ